MIAEAGIAHRALPATAQPGAGPGDGHHEAHGEGCAARGPGHGRLQLCHGVSVAGQQRGAGDVSGCGPLSGSALGAGDRHVTCPWEAEELLCRWLAYLFWV